MTIVVLSYVPPEPWRGFPLERRVRLFETRNGQASYTIAAVISIKQDGWEVVWSGGKSPAEIQQEHNAVSFGVAYGYDLRDHEVTGNVTVVRQCEPSLICFLSWILIVENL